MKKSRCALTRRAANMIQPTENQPTFNTCYSSLPSITRATNQHSSSSCKGTSGLFHIMGLNTMIFAVLKAWLMSPLHSVINWKVFYIDFVIMLNCSRGRCPKYFADVYSVHCYTFEITISGSPRRPRRSTHAVDSFNWLPQIPRVWSDNFEQTSTGFAKHIH